MATTKTPRAVGVRKSATQKSPLAPESTDGSAAIDLESEIRRRAYELYLLRGCSPGQENEDWFIAEREIKARHNMHSTGASA